MSLFEPEDKHNQSLQENVFPQDWKNPKPTGSYNIVVIGGGTAGLVTAAGAAGLGAKVALIERRALGGDCLNIGCVPSKALIRSARAIAEARDVVRFGAKAEPDIEIDFPAIMERMRRLRASIGPHDSAQRFKDLGIDVYLGDAQFKDAQTVTVAGVDVQFSKAVIATGGRPKLLPIEGLKEANPLTNENLFSLTQLPKRLAIIGAGPIGCEMAQTFARFGSEVTVFERSTQLMSKEDADAAAIVEKRMKQDGVQFFYEAMIDRVESANGEHRLHFSTNEKTHQATFDKILVGAGRTPNVEGLGLEKANVQTHEHGVQVDDHLRTSNPNIFVVGDVAMKHKFTHAADAAARIVIQNALFFGRKKVSDLVMPWCTYTDPEIAHVGMYEHEARDAGIAVQTIEQPMKSVDRAILDSETEGLLKIHLKKGSDKILGATLVSQHAGETLPELTLAITGKIGLSSIGNTIHTYPTQAEVVKKAADAYSRQKLTPAIAKIFKTFLQWRR